MPRQTIPRSYIQIIYSPAHTFQEFPITCRTKFKVLLVACKPMWKGLSGFMSCNSPHPSSPAAFIPVLSLKHTKLAPTLRSYTCSSCCLELLSQLFPWLIPSRHLSDHLFSEAFPDYPVGNWSHFYPLSLYPALFSSKHVYPQHYIIYLFLQFSVSNYNISAMGTGTLSFPLLFPQ